MQDDWTRRYLHLLEVEPRPPSKQALDHIVSHHRRVLFENVSSLVRRFATGSGPVPAIDLDGLLTEWQQGRAGGLCFSVAAMLTRLLRSLGYDARSVMGQITFPGSHQAVLVTLDGKRYLVDAGNGAPFYEAIDVDEGFEVHRAGLSFRFHPGRPGLLVQERFVHGAWQPFFEYELRKATEEERELAYQRHHKLPPEGWVVGSLRLVRCLEDEVMQLAGHEFSRYTSSGKHTEEVYGRARFQEVVADAFGAPELPLAEGLKAWNALTGEKI